MSPTIAAVVYVAGMIGLFYLDRDRSLRTSKALWLPVIWLWIVGSRAVSTWMNISPEPGTDVQLDGSPIDRFVFLLLLVATVIVLVRRHQKVATLLRASWPLLIYFAFCLVSIFWSDFPEVAAKRWIKSIGDLAMVLVIVTDDNMQAALRRVISRVGFILLPASVLFIKYFPSTGRGYSAWEGTPWNVGVTTNKNSLGVIVFVIALGALWRVLALLPAKGQSNRGRHLLAQIALLVFGIQLLVLADSATSRACFGLGAVLMVAASMPAFKRHPAAVHALILTLMLVGGSVALFGGKAIVAHAMGRKSDLTGRTEIWGGIIPLAPNPVVGAGFESFWLGPRLNQIRAMFEGNPLNEAHNGYIEAYLNLGWIGVGLILNILIGGYRRAAAAYRHDPAMGGLLLAYVTSAAIYGFTEAGFRMLMPVWIFLLLAVVAGSALSGTIAPRSPGTGTLGEDARRSALEEAGGPVFSR